MIPPFHLPHSVLKEGLYNATDSTDRSSSSLDLPLSTRGHLDRRPAWPQGLVYSNILSFPTTPSRVLEVVLHYSVGYAPSTGLSRHQCSPVRLVWFYSYDHPVLSSPRPLYIAYSDRSYIHVSDRICLLVHNRRDYSDPNRRLPFLWAVRDPWIDPSRV